MKFTLKKIGLLELLVISSIIYVTGMLFWTLTTRPAVEAKANLVKENHQKVVDFINKQINNRQGLINNLRRDLKIKSEEISTLRMLISSLKNDLKILNEEYSEMVYYSYKSKS